MIYFRTLYFKCREKEAHRIEDRLGMPHFMTVNGEAPVVMSDEGMKILRYYEKKNKIEIRNKLNTGDMVSQGFLNAIDTYLKKECESDASFKAKMEAHPEKDAKAACEYILSEVYKNGQGGYDDAEVYGMAAHFIQEDELKPKPFNERVRVEVNHHVELSDEQKKKAEQEAIEEYKKKVMMEEREKEVRRQEREAKKKAERIEKLKKEESLQPSLFD